MILKMISIQRLTRTLDLPAVFIIRLMVGGVFVSEGIQKFLNPAEVGAGRFAKIGLPSPEMLGPFVGTVEIVFGALVLAGLLTRIAVVPLLIIMGVAIWTTKIPILMKGGFWKMAHDSRNDYCMVLGSLFLLIVGAGKWSIDWYLAKRVRKTLAAGVPLLALAIHAVSCNHIEAAELKESGSSAAQGGLGNIQGVVTFAGEIPKSPVPDDAGVRREIIEVDGNSRGLRNVVVYLTQTNGLLLSAPPSTASRNPTNQPEVDQRDHEFTPRVIAIRQGETVVFRNSDPANHNVRTTASVKQNEFNVFTGADGKYEHRFVVEPEYRPIRLGCDIHPWMRGWVFVLDHPYFAVSDERGRFRISQIPPGEYLLQMVQPDLKHHEQRKVEVRVNETRTVETVVRQKEARRP
jgi:putative oxidoreductase